LASKKAKAPIDSVGWLFFFVVLILLLGPVWYLLWTNRSADAEVPAIVGAGLLFAGVLAGLVTWVVNWALGARADRIAAKNQTSK